jgi:hypothetical protein
MGPCIVIIFKYVSPNKMHVAMKILSWNKAQVNKIPYFS